MKCIQHVDGTPLDGRILRACFGTTKYCNAFLKYQPCNNPDCLYLHDIGRDNDSFTKEEMLAHYGSKGQGTKQQSFQEATRAASGTSTTERAPTLERASSLTSIPAPLTPAVRVPPPRMSTPPPPAGPPPPGCARCGPAREAGDRRRTRARWACSEDPPRELARKRARRAARRTLVRRPPRRRPRMVSRCRSRVRLRASRYPLVPRRNLRRRRARRPHRRWRCQWVILFRTRCSQTLSIRASISIRAPFFASTPARRNRRRRRSNRALLDSVSHLKPNLRVSARFHTVRQVSRGESHSFARCCRVRTCAARVSKV